MIINQGNLSNLFTGFKAVFQEGFEGYKPTWQQIATLVPSTTKEEHYAWLGNSTVFREWIGERELQNLAAHGYRITNKAFESTVSVGVPDIEDDSYGVFRPMFTMLGEGAATHPDELVFGLLQAGFETPCYDGRPFFAANHLVNGKPVSNMQDGTGPSWYLLATGRSLKPIIYQRRKDYVFVRIDAERDWPRFNRNEIVYGADGRGNVGYGFWQMAFGSRAPLTLANYAKAREAMRSLKSEAGRSLKVTPNLMLVPPSLELAALDILKKELVAGGETNVLRGTAELLVSNELA